MQRLFFLPLAVMPLQVQVREFLHLLLLFPRVTPTAVVLLCLRLRWWWRICWAWSWWCSAAALSLALHGTTCQGWQQSAVQVDQADHVTRSTSIAPFAVFTWLPQDCSSFTLRVTGADTGLRRPQGAPKL